MEKEKSIFNWFCKEILKPFLTILLMIISCFTMLSALLYFCIEIDESKLAETRYCPSCGIDIVNH